MRAPILKILACGLILFTLLGPLVGLLASGVIPLFAWLAGGVPAALCGLLLALPRVLLDDAIRRWQRDWPAWLLFTVAFVPGAAVGAAVLLLYAWRYQLYFYNVWMTLQLGALAGGVCNALFWRMRFS